MGCNVPAMQVERRGRVEGWQRKPWQGDKSPCWHETNRGGVALSRRAEGSGQPSLSGMGCHRHINQPAELPSALTQRGSILPNRNQGWGGQGQGDFTSCALLAHIAAGVSWAAQPVNPMESLQQPKLGGGKRLIPLELTSLQDTTPMCPGSLKPSLDTLRSEQEKEKLQ